jgi:hypothetical protein
VKGSTLAVVVVVGLSVVGYALYEVTNRRDRPERRTPRHADEEEPERGSAPDRPRPDRTRRFEDPAPASRRAEAEADPEADPDPEPRPIEIPPPPPKPESLEEARERFDAWVAQVDEEIQKQKLGAAEPSEDKYRLYRIKGHHAVDGILHMLDHTDPDEMKEFREKQEIAHQKLEEMKYSGG